MSAAEIFGASFGISLGVSLASSFLPKLKLSLVSFGGSFSASGFFIENVNNGNPSFFSSFLAPKLKFSFSGAFSVSFSLFTY